jgi:hypothetical protein
VLPNPFSLPRADDEASSKLGARAFSSTREHHIEQLKASNAIEQQISIQSQTIVEKITALAQQ